MKVDVVNYIPTKDRSSAMKRFEAGELDSYDDMPTSSYRTEGEIRRYVHIAPYLGTYYYAIKTSEEQS